MEGTEVEEETIMRSRADPIWPKLVMSPVEEVATT